MKIREAVDRDLVFLGLRAADAAQAIAEMSRQLADHAGLDATTVAASLGERERLGSTSVGNGFAIPHCKLGDLEDIVVALARFEAGVDFGGNRHHEPVSFFFVVLSPPDRPAEHLQVLSQIARILKSRELRDELLGAADRDAVVVAVERAADREGL
ncbi:MAG TPA: PTS sugar transporter subunit IIA [Candidatus Sulfomarinibacteraceae bacterium]|nr:PTS sugar transporter subunit IIA [Candidatus Sulfomarinibacteraceae bacterium]